MMIEESETPEGGSPSEKASDALAERRARHADPAVIRRAEAAEAAVRNLETHLAALEQRLEEVARERERIAEQLSEREREVVHIKQGEYAEQQLRVEAEERSERVQREMRVQMGELGTRMEDTERNARELGVELEQVRRELSEANQAMALGERLRERGEELRERMGALEGRFAEMQREVALEREARQQAELELAHLRERDARLTPIVGELMAVAGELRGSFERELTSLREELQRQVIWERETYVRELTAMGARMEDLRFELARTAADLRAQLAAEPPVELLQSSTTEPQSEREVAHRQEMADALVAAVERLRTRVAEVKEIEEVQSASEPELVVDAEPEPAVEPEVVVLEPEPVMEPETVIEPEPELLVEPSVAVAAPGLVESSRGTLGHSGALGGKAVTSKPVALRTRALLVPAQRTSWLAPAIRRLAQKRDAKLAAELVIELLPAQQQIVESPLHYQIKIDELGTFHVAIDSGQAVISREASAAAIDFTLEGSAAAFSELAAGGASRKPAGLRVRKGRRGAKRLLKSRRAPLALSDLAAASIDVWPGLLLLAMAEAIDPTWTRGRRFELAFEIQNAPGIVIYVRIRDGEPILVSRSAAKQPVATVSVTGHSLICLLAGAPVAPEDKALVTGDTTSVEMFLDWAARAQGLIASTS
jgi:hypothetical protein